MNKQERIAIVRVVSDLIKADNIIDAGEMEMYARLRNKYRITEEIEQSAIEMSLSTAIRLLTQSEQKTRRSIINDCIAICDGRFDSSKALLTLAIKRCLGENPFELDDVISVNYPDVMIFDNRQVLYVESSYSKNINEEIEHYYQHISNELELLNFHFVYIPQVVARYRQYDENSLYELVRFLSPHHPENKIKTLIKSFSEITTTGFCISQLCNRFGMHSIRETVPALLIKICDNYVSGHLFANFLKIGITDNIISTIQLLTNSIYDLLNTSILTISHIREYKGRVLYRGYYKMLFDDCLTQQCESCGVVIDPFRGKLILPEINDEITGLHRKEKAFYALLIDLTPKGGACFMCPTNKSEYDSYKKRMRKIKMLYTQWYSLFGGDKEKVPDIENPNIRNSIMSIIRSSINKLRSKISNANDFMIQKNEKGCYYIQLRSQHVKIKRRPNNICAT